MKPNLRAWGAIACAFALALALGGTAHLFGQSLERITPVRPSSSTNVMTSEDQSPGSHTVPRLLPGASLSGDYRIGPEDILKIRVLDVNNLDEKVRVANDGTIVMPLLGRVKAAGLTSNELRDRLEKEFGKKFLQNPQVSVFVEQFHARPVSIVGAVENPGMYQVTGPRTLVEMLSLAGGIAKQNADPAGKLIYVTRKSGFGKLTVVPGMRKVAPDKIEINIKDLLYTKAEGLNIPIEANDIIAVSKAGVIYVAGGGVRSPGGFLLEDRDSVTVIQALAMAGGLAPNASRHYARIIQTEPNGSHIDTSVDLEKVIKNKVADPTLATNDILYVPSSRGKAALKRTTQAIIQTASGYFIVHP